MSCIFDECVADVITEGSRMELMLWELSGTKSIHIGHH